VHLLVTVQTKEKYFITVFVDGEFPVPPAESGSLLHSTLVATLHIFM